MNGFGNDIKKAFRRYFAVCVAGLVLIAAVAFLLGRYA